MWSKGLKNKSNLVFFKKGLSETIMIKNSIFKKIIIIFVIFCTIIILKNDKSYATNYYVSATGTSTTGTEENNPMNLATAKCKKYSGGDVVSFKCGDVFYGVFNFSVDENKISENNRVEFTSYGDGELPIFTTARFISENKSSLWTKVSGYTNVWSFNLDNTDGYYEVDTDSGTYAIYDIPNGVGNVGFLRDENNTIYGELCFSIDEVNESNIDYAFYSDSETLYVKSTENPTSKLGKITIGVGVDIGWVAKDCVVHNIHFKDGGKNGLRNKSLPAENIDVYDCIFENIGGYISEGVTTSSNNTSGDKTRAGNAFQIWFDSKGIATNINVYNNIVKNVYDTGLTFQGESCGIDGVKFHNNIIFNASMAFELWGTKNTSNLTNVEVYENYTWNDGSGWGAMYRPNYSCKGTYIIYGFGTASNSASTLSMKIYNNKSYNTKSIYFTASDVATILSEKKGYVQSCGNTYYIGNKSAAIFGGLIMDVSNSAGVYGQVLEEKYNLETGSTFIQADDVQNYLMNNYDIMDLNDYDKIKEYLDGIDNTVIKLKIKTLPNKTTYLKDTEDLDLTGGEVIVTYKDYSQEVIPMDKLNYSKKTFSNSTVGTSTVYLTYNEKTISFDVTINSSKTISSVKLQTLPTKTNYVKDSEDLDLTGGALLVTYSDGTTCEVPTNSSYVSATGFSKSKNVGTTETISLTYKSKTVSGTYNVTIIEKEVDKLEVSSLPFFQMYSSRYYSASVRTDSMVLKATYNDGTEEYIWVETLYDSSYSVVGYSTIPSDAEITIQSGLGSATLTESESFKLYLQKNRDTTHTLTFTYKGKSASFKYDYIDSNTVTNVTMVKQPTKLTYKKGDIIDLSGGQLKLTLTDGTTTTTETVDMVYATDDNTLVVKKGDALIGLFVYGFDNYQLGYNKVRLKYAVPNVTSVSSSNTQTWYMYFGVYVEGAIKGDIDGDGNISAYDAYLLLKDSFDSLWEKEVLRLGDWDADAEITAYDAYLVLKHSAK